MTKHFLALPLLAAGLSLAQPGPALAQAAPAITTSQDEIAYEEFTLPNGLRVVVHEVLPKSQHEDLEVDLEFARPALSDAARYAALGE